SNAVRYGRYARVIPTRPPNLAEITSVSSRFLAPWHRLSQTQEVLLSEHGWKPPDEYAPNFYQDFHFLGDRTTFAIDIAKNVLDALIHVYGVHETDLLVIRTTGD
ncbi:TY-Chap domain-containing protein, partial [Micromonospora sp. DT44]|uniref:TY-Chap domain-containing protein n=1 Tax=Micromonospora sp. DT44 TaxID=3393439 RepID=UPI003CF79977